jgi:deoxyhypusine synthase
VAPERLPDSVVCYLDSTVAMPLLTSYVLSRAKKRTHSRLYDRRGELLALLSRGVRRKDLKERKKAGR